ncbi:sensor histidine kinase YesM [Pedobacter cryoconitis]|uniref:Sensor histidine kinase YesM n=1 Tax=Pedobacter cryoconitis TaxID=188932 RepID=A0A7W9DXW9_9SPHI|nr:sensor histidine kinase [Pedobacter cryoconitis]MBB5635363.1 sensor histidine kinase YesM [Pedobacter cryoconitis]
MKSLILNFANQYKYHFLVWGLFFAYEIILVGMLTEKLAAPEIYIFHYIFYVFLFYFHANVVLEYILNSPSKAFRFSLLFFVLLELAVFICLKYGCEVIFYKYVAHILLEEDYKVDKQLIIGFTWRPLYFLCYSTGYYFLVHSQRQSQLVAEMQQQELNRIIQEKEIKNELILTQNAFLKAQINPDFLINVLNYLHHETLQTSPKAAESILSLSDIMKYALSTEAASGNVLLENEIRLIETFLLLHQARQVHQAELKLTYNQACLPIRFVPLILMTLTENILKHGQLNDPNKPAEIKINYENSVLRIETSNYESSSSQIPGHGIGLRNIKERLSLAYGESASFNYHLDSKRYFNTSIVIQI